MLYFFQIFAYEQRTQAKTGIARRFLQEINKIENAMVKKKGTEVINLSDKIDELEENANKLATDISVMPASTEQEEKQKRASNIIIRGIKEGTKVQDTEAVMQIFQDVSGTDQTDEVENMYRLGKKKADRGRPIRVIKKSEHQKWKILASAPKVRNSLRWKLANTM